MTGYAHETCDTKVYCPHLISERCLCCMSDEDARQKFLDPALIFVKGPRDNRVIHFIQPHIDKTVSEYRSNYKWPDRKCPVAPYVPPKDYMRFESKREYAKIYPVSKPKVEKSSMWNKGIAEQIFDKNNACIRYKATFTGTAEVPMKFLIGRMEEPVLQKKKI